MRELQEDISPSFSEDPQKILHRGEADGETSKGGELCFQAEGNGELPKAEEPAEEQGEQGGEEGGEEGGEVPAGEAHHLHRRTLCRRPQAGYQQCQGAGESKGQNGADVSDPEIS